LAGLVILAKRPIYRAVWRNADIRIDLAGDAPVVPSPLGAQMTSVTVVFTTIGLGLLVAACSTSPDPKSFGGKLQSQGGKVSAIGEKWSKGDAALVEGRALVKEGQDDVESGKARVRKGESKISRGEDLISQGNKLKQEAEDEYKVLEANRPRFGDQPQATPPQANPAQ
jgi:hypothetical protein